MMIVGDMNAPLPTTAELSRCWYRKHPYNKHGFVLYLFFRSKDLEIDVPYTVFNTTSNTYIDHVFSSNFAADAIKSCSIISNSALNVSDHYPLHTLIELCFKDDAISDVSNDAPSFPRINWSDSQICSLYSQYVIEKATHLPDVKSDEVKSRREAVGLMCNAMVTSMYASSSKAITSTKSSSKHDKNSSLKNGGAVTALLHVTSSDSGTVYGDHVVVHAKVKYMHVIKLPRNSIELPVSKPWIVTWIV